MNFVDAINQHQAQMDWYWQFSSQLIAHTLGQVAQGWTQPMSALNEHERQVRLHKALTAMKENGIDAKQVLADLGSMSMEDAIKNQTALELLKEWITKEEMQEFLDKGEISIKSKLTPGKVYKITKGKTDLTQIWHNGVHTNNACVHAQNAHDLPTGDAVLTKVLALKGNEREFLRNCNITTAPFTTARSSRQVNPPTHVVATSGGVGDYFVAYGTGHTGYTPTNYGYAAQQYAGDLGWYYVNQQEIGRISPLPQFQLTPNDYITMIIRKTAAKAMLDGTLSPNLSGLSIRALSPQDLVNTTQVGGNIRWLQRIPTGATEHRVYQTNIYSNSDRKVMAIYGFCNLDNSKPSPISRIDLWVAARRMAMVEMNHSHRVDAVILQEPVYLRRGEDIQMNFVPNYTDDTRAESRIQVLGCVCERLGENVA